MRSILLRLTGGFSTIALLMLSVAAYSEPFNGIDNSLSSLYRTSDAQSRSVSAENFTGERGRGAMATEGTGQSVARNLGQGWKVSPSIVIKAGGTFTLADVSASGAIQHIWMTTSEKWWRAAILRIYWDGETEPSVETPLGDFFAMGWGEYAHLNSLPVAVNPGKAFNSYWVMPFRKNFRIALQNISAEDMYLYYQIDYSLAEVPKDAAYFHAQFRRVNPLKFKDVYTIVDGVKGQGQYVGTYMAWGVRHSGWWGEGEIKFYLDGDQAFPTIVGTGTEDYFCGSHDFVDSKTHEYQEFSGVYSGLVQVIRPEDADRSTRFGLYRWHIADPIRFKKDLRVTVQALGWQQKKPNEFEYLPLQEDIASVAFWYQTEPHAKFPPLPTREELAVN
jgi:D-arabinan exo alpha-(1,3)/(1,5)-arabinofuranosidase (non-reducing end)